MELADLPNEVRHAQHPVLRGASSYRIEGHHISLSVEEIANPRPHGDVSGTLSLELWALDQPYDGGSFTGFAMGGTKVGELFGQYFLGNGRFRADYQEPPAGKWFLSLMLREWTHAGSVTRDYVNFPLPYIIPSAAGRVHTEASPSAPSSDEGTAAEAARHSARKPAARKTTEAHPSAEHAKSKAVSINKAALPELAAIKGMSKKLAESIVAARPFASLDELVKVKGMGPKLLDKLRSTLSL